MATNEIVKATTGIVSLLESLESEERNRAISAALTLLGESQVPAAAPPASGLGGSGVGRSTSASASASEGKDEIGSHKQFFASKVPKNKGEEIAVAARYRELKDGASVSTKDEIKAVINGARRNFDANNYMRDLNNARTKGLFNRKPATDCLHAARRRWCSANQWRSTDRETSGRGWWRVGGRVASQGGGSRTATG